MWLYDGFSCSMSATYDGAVLLWQGSINEQFCTCFLLLQEANEVILNVWLY